MSGYAPLVQTLRGGHPECLHQGAIAVVDMQGKVLAHVGDPHLVTFSRSTLKALQALPFVSSGGITKLGLASEEVALLCASHSGEDKHVAAAQRILDKAGVPARQLQCGCHVPYYLSDAGAVPPPSAGFDARHNNCSGKHAGFLAYCALHGLPQDTYLDSGHPLQEEIRRQVARALRIDESTMPMGIDGCSAPNYAMPLSALGVAYARLAQGAADTEFGAAFEPLFNAMTAHPDMVSGTGRNDADYMRAGRGDWVSKVGAAGLQVIGSKSRRQALVVKIADGDKSAVCAASIEALDQLGWLDDAQRTALAPWRCADIVNVRGLKVGQRLPLFQLAGAMTAGG
jgi:L-asparaginase II